MAECNQQNLLHAFVPNMFVFVVIWKFMCRKWMKLWSCIQISISSQYIWMDPKLLYSNWHKWQEREYIRKMRSCLQWYMANRSISEDATANGRININVLLFASQWMNKKWSAFIPVCRALQQMSTMNGHARSKHDIRAIVSHFYVIIERKKNMSPNKLIEWQRLWWPLDHSHSLLYLFLSLSFTRL